MTPKAMKYLAQELVASIRAHVSERLGPLQSRLDATQTVLNDQRERLDALEAEVREMRATLALKRVA